jgi:hypothetical protein
MPLEPVEKLPYLDYFMVDEVTLDSFVIRSSTLPSAEPKKNPSGTEKNMQWQESMTFYKGKFQPKN